MEKLKRNNAIDFFRGLAILSVIFLHLNTRISFSKSYIGSQIPNTIFKLLFWSGYYGVCIFFVISGFLITTSVLTKWVTLPAIKVKEFYILRFARIIPLLLALLVILSMQHVCDINGFTINTNQTSLVSAIFAALTFHINWLEIQTGYLPPSWDVLWSLSIEEMFYIFFPLACVVTRHEKVFILLISLFFIISPLARTLFIENDLADRNYLAYMDCIAMGCIAAVITKRVEIKPTALFILSAVGYSCIIFILVFRKEAFDLGLVRYGLNVSVLAIGTALLLINLQKRFELVQRKRVYNPNVISFMGRNSYEVYLTHMFVVLLFVKLYENFRLGGEWVWGLLGLTIVVSGILGELVARYLSNPTNKLIRNFAIGIERKARSGPDV